ncbi:MAG TPA: ABC transporter permease, partial [Vicinamibacteria bacterium]
MGALGLDFRYALRQLAKNPGFTAVVVLTLALGIGANTAIFTLMDQVLFRKLPVREPESLVILDAPGRYSGSTHSHDGSLRPVSHSAFLALRDSGIFSGVLAYYTAAVHVGADGETERADGCLVSGTYFEVLGLRPAAGRLFTPDDDRTAGAHPVVVLGHGYWQRRFAGDPGVVGRTLSINGGPMTVVGVAPRGFHGTDVGGAIDVYVPLMMQRQVIPIWSALDTWRVAWLTPFARLKDGLSLEETRARVDVLYRRLLEEDLQTIEAPSVSLREAFLKKTLRLLPGAHGASVLRTESRPALLVLTGMVGLVLLIACGNLANLLLARASSRQREVAVRLALGASRARLLRQLLVESLVSSLLGGVLGLAMSSWAASLLLRALPDEGARRVLSPDPDWRVALFALLLACATGVLFGLAPALQSTHPGVFQTLRQEAGNLVGSGGPLRIR